MNAWMMRYADRCRTGVVHNDKFPVLLELIDHRADRLIKQFLAVVRRHDHRKEWGHFFLIASHPELPALSFPGAGLATARTTAAANSPGLL